MAIADLSNGMADLKMQPNQDATSNANAHQGTRGHRRPQRAYHTFENSNGVGSAPPLTSAGPFLPDLNQGPMLSDNPYQQAATSNSSIPAVEAPLAAPQQTASHFIPTQRVENQQMMLLSTFSTATDSVPPLATTQFYAEDQGTCDPRLMALSMYNIPNEEHLRAATKLPVAVSVQPFATLIPNDSIPVVDVTQEPDGPMRCRRCRSYVNCRYKFTFDSKMICNLCGIKSSVPASQLAPLGPNGLRSDVYERPELMKGAVEFLVPSSYNAVRDTNAVPLHYVFLVDLSAFANENKSSLAAIEGVRASVEYISQYQPNCKVAIIAFDEWIRFFNLRSELEQTQEFIVNDPKDVFLPLNKGLFALPSESMHVIQDVLFKLETYVTDERFIHRTQSCFGSAVEAAKLALLSATNGQGGKIVAHMNTLPTAGHGNLSIMRDDGTKKHLRCEDEFYRRLSQELLKSWIGIDLFVTSTGFIDLATTAYPTLVTSGSLHYYSNFNINKDELTLGIEFLNSVKDTVGYQGMLKVRSSSGLSVYNYYSESVKNTDEEPIIPVLTKNQTFDVLFKYDDKLKVGEEASFQAALLYTDLNGVRKVRVLNSNAAVNSNVAEVFKFVNQDVITRILVKDVLATLGDCDFAEIRRTIDHKMTEIFTQYRALCGGTPRGQLILPDSLKTLPMYMLAFEKSELMKQNKSSSRGNERFYDFFKLLSYAPAQLSYKLYPQIFPLHESLEDTDFTFYDEQNKMLQFKGSETLSVGCSHPQLVNGGCYLIFQGEVCYLWLNDNTNSALIKDLLSLEEGINQIDIYGGTLPELDTQINIKARNILQNWRQNTNLQYIPVLPLRPNIDPYYSHVMNQLLVEDRSIEMVDSLDGYLITLHRNIKENIENDRFIKIHKGSDEGHENFAQKFVHF